MLKLAPLISFLFALAAIQVEVRGAEQVITVYENYLPGDDNENNTFVFHASFKNIAEEYPHIGRIQRVCIQGMWNLYYEPNYGDKLDESLGNMFEMINIVCHLGEWLIPVKSFNHWGALDVNEDALNFFPKPEFEGLGVMVNATGNLPEPMYSFTGTGSSSWFLFEEPDFQGKSLCFIVPDGEALFNAVHNVNQTGVLSKFQSVFKTCKDFEGYMQGVELAV